MVVGIRVALLFGYTDSFVVWRPAMSNTVKCTAGDLQAGDRIVAVNGHPPPGGDPVEVLAVGWGLVSNVLRVTLSHQGRDVVQPLHAEEKVEVQR